MGVVGRGLLEEEACVDETGLGVFASGCADADAYGTQSLMKTWNPAIGYDV